MNMETIKVSFEIQTGLGVDYFENQEPLEALDQAASRAIRKNIKFKVVKPKPEPKKEYLEPGWYERSDMPIDESDSYVLHVTAVEKGRSIARWFQLATRDYTYMKEFQLDISPTSYNVENGYTFRKLVAEDKKMFRYGETPTS